MNQKYRLVAVLSIVTFVQGCEFMTVADALSALNSIPASSSSSNAPSYIYSCEPIENSANLTTPTSSSDLTNAQPDSVFVQGTYIAEITGENVRAVSLHRRPIISITQYGNEIKGTFDTDYGGKHGSLIKGEIEGTIRGKTITFDWYSTSNHGTGEWQLKPGSNNLTGTWKRKDGGAGSGDWSLIKCRVTAVSVEGVVKKPTQKAANPQPMITTPDDISGTYDVTLHDIEKQADISFIFNSRETFRIRLDQQDEKISGEFISGFTGKLDGIFVDGQYRITWYTAGCGDGEGNFINTAEHMNLSGSWYCRGYTRGSWKLRKLE